MSDTTFTNGVTLTDADWFNDLNRLHYTIFGDPATARAAFDSLLGRGSSVASAATLDLTSTTGDFVHVTGTTSITAITLSDGDQRTLVFDGVLTFTHSASLVCPGSLNITTAVGDVIVVRGDASSVVRVVSYAQNAIPKTLVTAAGDMIYATAASTPTRLAIGTAGKPLVVNSGATAPQWGFDNQTANTIYAGPTTGGAAAPSFRAIVAADVPASVGTAMVYLGSFTPSSSASASFVHTAGTGDVTFDWSAYDVLEFRFRLVPATDQVQLLMTVSENSGTSYLAGTNYSWSLIGTTDVGAAASALASGGTTSSIALTSSGGSGVWANAASSGATGTVVFYGPQTGSRRKNVEIRCGYSVAATNNFIGYSGGGIIFGTPANLSGVKFAFSSGNISTGIIRAYGIKNS